MMLPSRLAICKCKAHGKGQDYITLGNAKADEEAKEAALLARQLVPGTVMPLITAEIETGNWHPIRCPTPCPFLAGGECKWCFQEKEGHRHHIDPLACAFCARGDCPLCSTRPCEPAESSVGPTALLTPIRTIEWHTVGDTGLRVRCPTPCPFPSQTECRWCSQWYDSPSHRHYTEPIACALCQRGDCPTCSRRLCESRYQDTENIGRTKPYMSLDIDLPKELAKRITVIESKLHQYTPSEASVLVNPANERLTNGAGMALAIRHLAGDKYQRDCQLRIAQWGPLDPTELFWTEAYDLQPTYDSILHVPIPHVAKISGPANSETTLQPLYARVFEACRDRGKRSITMTLFGCGSYGHDPRESMRAFLKAAITSLGQSRVDLLVPDVLHAQALRATLQQAQMIYSPPPMCPVVTREAEMEDGRRVRVTIVPPPAPDLVELTTPQYMRDHVRPIQDRAPTWEVRLWEDRGATKGGDGIWRNQDGRTVAPISFLDTLIQCAHDPDHCARGEVKQQILDSGFWAPGLQDRIAYVLRNCRTCNMNNIRKGMAPRPIGHIPLPEGPFKHITMDYIDMSKKVNNFQHVLVVVCRYSRWVEACPTAKQDEKTVTRFLTREIIPRFGIPETISSDNGQAFVARVWKRIAQKLRIRVRFGCVYHPQSQGMVERANGTLKNKILKICQSTDMNWVDALPIALMKMRCEKNRTTHLTPHEMLTGRAMPVPMIREGRGPTLETLNREVQLYIRQLSHVHKTIFNEQKNREKKLGRSAQEERRPVQPGDYVYLRVFKRSCLDPRAEGPYKVVQATPRAVRVEGSKLWYHLNSCYRAQRPERGDDGEPEPAPADPGEGPNESDGGEGPSGGADADRSTTEREERAPDEHRGADMSGVSFLFSPQSVSAGDSAGEGPGGRETESLPDPFSAGATTGTPGVPATSADAETVHVPSGDGDDPVEREPGGGAVEWGRPPNAEDLLTIGDDLWISEPPAHDPEAPEHQSFLPGGFMELLHDPGTPQYHEILARPAVETPPYAGGPGPSQEPEPVHPHGHPTTQELHERGGEDSGLATLESEEPEPDYSGTKQYPYSYGGLSWNEYEPPSDGENPSDSD